MAASYFASLSIQQATYLLVYYKIIGFPCHSRERREGRAPERAVVPQVFR